jgi:hypothetical protein
LELRKEIIERINVLSLSQKMKNIINGQQFELHIFNALVDAILLLSNRLSDITKTEIDSLENTTAKMVEILELLQGNYDESLKRILLENKYMELVSSLNKLCKEIDENLSIKIIIFGSKKTTKFLSEKIKHKYIKIIETISDDDVNLVRNSLLNGVLIDKDSFDLLILSDVKVPEVEIEILKLGINKEKVINFEYYLTLFINDYQSYYNTNYFHSMLSTRLAKIIRKNHYDTVVSGLSYSLRGIVEDEVEKTALKFALPSQDLYYDQLIVKDILESGVKLKYYILGLAYYSFDWDLSLAKQESSRIINTYYPVFKDSHNLKLDPHPSISQGISAIKESINPIILLIFGEGIYEEFIEELLHVNLTPEFDEQLWNSGTYLRTPIVEIDPTTRRILGKERAGFHNKLNYPSSRLENKEILSNILKILQNNGVKPIVTIFPTTKYYYENFSSETKNTFYSIINELSKEHNFQVIDLFTSDKFEDTDFVDWDHLNKQGASKMTKMLNKMINW